MKDRIYPRMNVIAILYDEFGNIKDERFVHNMVVTSGLNYIADALSTSPGNTVMTHMAVGSGTAATSAATTDLQTIIEDRHALTGGTPTDSGAIVTYTCTWEPAAATGAITEAGIFNAVAAGTMLCRVVFDVMNKAAGDTLAITWTCTISDDGIGV